MPDDDLEAMATVREEDGRLVLHDPVGLAVLKAVARHNCKATFESQADRVAYFVRRMAALGSTSAEMIIVLLNVDDPHGRELAAVLMPEEDDDAWQKIRDSGAVPFARGLAVRGGVERLVNVLDPEIGAKLQGIRGVAVVVMDHGVVEVFAAEADR